MVPNLLLSLESSMTFRIIDCFAGGTENGIACKNLGHVFQRAKVDGDYIGIGYGRDEANAPSCG